MPTAAATARAARSLSPVSSTGRRPRPRSRVTASAEVGLTVSATMSTPRTAPSQAANTTVWPGGLGAVRRGRRARPGPAAPTATSSQRRGRRATACPSTTPRDAEPPGSWRSPRRRGAVGRLPCPAAVPARPGRDRRGDRVLGGVLDRPGQPQQVARVVAGRGGHVGQAIRPVVTVPVLSSTMVSTARVDSSTSGPLIRMPSCAPRPVPTRSAVGVARPIAHGQAMISTATAAVNAAPAGCPATSQAASVTSAISDDDRDEDRGDPVGEPLHRRLAGLRRRHEPGRSGRAGCRRRPGWRGRPAGRRCSRSRRRRCRPGRPRRAPARR